MKKIISILFSMTILVSMALSVNANLLISVTVDGEAVDFDAQPEMVNERTMVPMRAIFEKLGAEVSWDQPTQTVTAVAGDKRITATVGETSMFVNGEEKVMDVAPYIKEERTYVPARFVSEALGCVVDWDQENHTVIITSTETDDYMYTYNAIKDFTVKNGMAMDSGQQWMYGEDIDGIQVIFNYDEYRGFAEIGFVMHEDEAEVVQIISAAKTGECLSTTTLTSLLAEEPIRETLVIKCEDGRATIDNLPTIPSSFDEMSTVAVEAWKVIDQILQIIDPECSVSDFGVRLPDKIV